jgi:hypothetical protein
MTGVMAKLTSWITKLIKILRIANAGVVNELSFKLDTAVSTFAIDTNTFSTRIQAN